MPSQPRPPIDLAIWQEETSKKLQLRQQVLLEFAKRKDWVNSKLYRGHVLNCVPDQVAMGDNTISAEEADYQAKLLLKNLN